MVLESFESQRTLYDKIRYKKKIKQNLKKRKRKNLENCRQRGLLLLILRD